MTAHIKNPKTNDELYFPFSPPIFKTEVDPSFTKELIVEGEKLTIEQNDMRSRLAGNMKSGGSYRYTGDFVDKSEKYLLQYIDRFFDTYGIVYPTSDEKQEILLKYNGRGKERILGQFKLDELWINYQHKHDFNPQHTHSGEFSFVIYCQVDPKIFEVNAVSNTALAGQIQFECGESISKIHHSSTYFKPYNNCMFIFPAKLKHSVNPFWVDSTRISVSGNFYVV